MLQKLENYILERHIRKVLEKYYAQFGLTLKEAKTLSIYNLLVKIDQHLADKEKTEEEIKQENKTENKTYINEGKSEKSLYAEDIIAKQYKIAQVKAKEKEEGLFAGIRNLMKENYANYALTKEDAVKLSDKEILEKIHERLTATDKEFAYYTSVVNNLEKKVDRMVIEAKENRERMTQMKSENKGLRVENAKLTEENYKLKLENSLYKQNFNSKSNEKKNEQSLSVAK